MARIVATLENCDISSSNARGKDLFFGKSPLVVSPQDSFVASSDDSILKAGSSEILPGMPEGGLPVAATDHNYDI
jgi:hypothetical protein